MTDNLEGLSDELRNVWEKENNLYKPLTGNPWGKVAHHVQRKILEARIEEVMAHQITCMSYKATRTGDYLKGVMDELQFELTQLQSQKTEGE
jgi:hypothetical protein